MRTTPTTPTTTLSAPPALLASITLLVAFLFLLPQPARAQSAAPAAAVVDAWTAASKSAAWNIPGAPTLPVIIPYYDSKAYAWAWDAPAQIWRLIPRNEARILDHTNFRNKQLIGQLIIDGDYAVPVVDGQNVLLAFRKETDFKTYNGLPASESGFEVTKLEVNQGPRKSQLIRTATLLRRGEAAATFGDKREPIAVQKITRQDGVFHVIQVLRPLSPGRYALYLPDRAFEFEAK